MPTPPVPRPLLPLDTLDTEQAAQVMLMDGLSIGDGAVREPHRHDYHELIWVRRGCGEHRIDGVAQELLPGTLTIVGRGQVHQFHNADGVGGAVLRFGDELLAGGAQRIATGWLLNGLGGRTFAVPEGEHDRVDGILAAIAAETQRPQDAYSADVQRNLIATVLLWAERWYDATRSERTGADDAAVQLHRRFSDRLEQDFVRHHDAAHYAQALGIPAPALSRSLTQLTGRGTKELILDRVMLEAARLLRFTDLTVGEVAHRVGFDDQLYFSRAFKRRFGRPPLGYRAGARGTA